MKAPIMKVLLKTSLFIVHFSKKYLKKPSRTFFNEKSAPDRCICGFCEISFKCSINQPLEYHDLTKVITARILTNFTLVLQRISVWQFLMIFCYTELLFARHSECDRTLISSRTSRSQRLEKLFLEIISKIFPGRQTQQLQIYIIFQEETVCNGIRLIFSNAEGFFCFLYFQ